MPRPPRVIPPRLRPGRVRLLRARVLRRAVLQYRAGRRRDDPHGRRQPDTAATASRSRGRGSAASSATPCIAATVGLLLRAIEERVGWLGRIVVKLIGVAWALATFLVVPVLVTRDVGPIDAVKESAALLRETWGENLIGNRRPGARLRRGVPRRAAGRRWRYPGRREDRAAGLIVVAILLAIVALRAVGAAGDDAGRVFGRAVSLCDRTRAAVAGLQRRN